MDEAQQLIDNLALKIGRLTVENISLQLRLARLEAERQPPPEPEPDEQDT